METEILTNDLNKAAGIIKNGGLVAVPTETVYGLAGNGLDKNAVDKIYEVKGRPRIKPLSLMVPGEESIKNYCNDIPEAAYNLAGEFWPGPLTIVLNAKTDLIPDIVLAGGNTVGLRCPDSSKTLELLKLAGVPFAAPSANPSDSKSPVSAEDVLSYFSGKIDAVIDGGECREGFESTIIDLSKTPYRILRQGALGEDEITKALVRGIKKIGITGGSGTGKTTALFALEELGAYTLDCDELYHDMLRSDKDLISEILDSFSEASDNGAVNRKKLASIVFSDRNLLLKLNEITHKHVMAEIDNRLKAAALNGYTLAGIDAVELFGSGASALCDLTVGVLAEKKVRLKRIIERDGIYYQDALARINAQKDDSYFKEHCDYVVYNNDDMDSFHKNCIIFFKEII